MRHLITIMEDYSQGVEERVLNDAVEIFLSLIAGNDYDTYRHDIEPYFDDRSDDFSHRYDDDDDDDDEDGEGDDDDDHQYNDEHTPTADEINTAAKRWAEDVCDDTYYSLRRLVHNGVVPVWRMITAPPTWKPGAEPLGVYWSWDEHAAEAHWGSFDHGHVKWLMHGAIAASDIDWPNTVAHNAYPPYEEEKEITLRKGGKIHLFWYMRVGANQKPVPVDQVMEAEDQ